MTNKISFLLVLFLAQLSFSQNAWTKKKGEAYTQLSFSTISNYSELFGNPDYNTEREVTDNTLQLYAEYGVTDKTTLIASIPLKLVKTGDIVTGNSAFTTADSKSSLGNIALGVRHRFVNKKWVISGQLNIEAETSSLDLPSGLSSGYQAWTFTPTINFGRSFGNSYIQAFTGFDVRTNSFSSNFKIGGEYGIKPVKDIWLIGFVDVSKSFKNGDVVLPISNLLTGLYVNNQEYGAFGLKAIGEITDKFGANLGFGGAFFGRNVAKKAALSIGLYHKF